MAKRNEPDRDWAITFVDPNPLITIIKCVSFLQHVTCKVSCVEGRYFLTVDGADVGYTSCVSSKLLLDEVSFHDLVSNDFSFCVDCRNLLIALDTSASGHGSLVLEGHGPVIRIKLFDPDVHSYEDSSEIATVHEHDDAGPLAEMNFDMMVEIDIPKFRDFIRKVLKTHCELLRLSIYLKENHGKQQSLVIFSATGDCVHHMKFCHTTTRDTDGSIIVRAAPDGGDDLFDISGAELKFNHAFPVDKIDAFLKPLQSKQLKAKVKKGMPLLLAHEFSSGTNESWIRFLIAARSEDEE